MVRRRHKTAAQRIHLCKRTDLSGIAEIIYILSSGHARTGRGLHRYDAIVRLSPDFLADKRRNQTAQIGTAARTADDHIRLDIIFSERRLRLLTDDGLV